MLPFKLQPAYKDYLWGGTKLKTEYGKDAPLEVVAESWELSAHPDGPSVIADGEMKGATLAELFKARPALFGTNNQDKDEFPILAKLIDAKGSLSIQVHPDDDYARRVEGEAGKTEMWVVLENEPDAFLYHGFKAPITKEEFAARIEDGTLPEVLKAVPVKAGDVFFIEAGTIHAIGAGVLLAEVQQNSNSTYRVFDFGRLGPDGKPRQLHVEKALDVTRLEVADKTAPGAKAPQAVEGGSLARLAACPNFTVDRLMLDGRFSLEMDGSSFVSVLCTEGAGKLFCGGAALSFAKGDSLFVPADQTGLTLEGRATLLLTTV